MSSYWYSTNGLVHRRLSIRHLNTLDQAFEKHARVQIFDDELFGRDIPAIANPYQGTMTAGEIHYGLYRQPPMWRMSDSSLNTLILMDMSTVGDDKKDDTHKTTTSKYTKFIQKRKLLLLEESCIYCCTIS